MTLLVQKKRILLRYSHHFASCLINNMDHMRISDTKPSSEIHSLQMQFKKLRRYALNAKKKSGIEEGW